MSQIKTLFEPMTNPDLTWTYKASYSGMLDLWCVAQVTVLYSEVNFDLDLEPDLELDLELDNLFYDLFNVVHERDIKCLHVNLSPVQDK